MAKGDVELGHVDFDATVQLLLKYDEEVENPSDQRKGSILMVPSVFRDLSPCSFTPRVVSIGPLHHQDEHLKGFEVHKATYMHHLFHNVLRPIDSTPEQTLKACVTKVSGSVDQIKACYLGMQAYPDSELVKMMIPFFVLEDIFECTFAKLHPTVPLARFIIVIHKFCKLFEGDLVMDNSNISTTYDHILGFLHKSYQNPDRDSSRLRKTVKPHSVVKLDRLGVRFSNILDAKWPMATKLKYSRNLIIYEQSAQVQTCVTSYMCVMDYLIDTPEDVAKLVRSQVLVNVIGSNEEAADIINDICKQVPFKDFYYEDELKQMDEYYNAYWPNLIAELRRKYFKNPQGFIVLLAGIVLFILIVVQTVYGVKVIRLWICTWTS
ncbi:UPF0481 protein-like protein [Tanacetum coccineum]